MGTRQRPLRSHLSLVMFIIVAALVTAAGLLLFFTRERDLRASSVRLMEDTINRIEEKLNRNMYSVNTLALLTISSPDTLDILMSPGTSSSGRQADVMRLENIIRHRLAFDEAWNNRLIDSVFIFIEEDHYAAVLRRLPTSGTNNRAQECYRAALSSERAVNLFFPEKDGESFYLSYIIRDLNINRRMGVCVLEVSPNMFEPVLELAESYPGAIAELSIEENLLISTGNDGDDPLYTTIIAGKKPLEQDLNGSSFYAFKRPLTYFSFSLMGAIPVSEVYRGLNNVLFTYVLVTALVMLSLLWLVRQMIRRVTRHLESHVEAIAKVGSGDYSIKVEKSGIEEIDRITYTFNEMVAEIDTLIHEVYEKKMLEAQSELKSLQAQINPHFLFNVLESINWEAKRADDEVVSSMIISLGELLRASLYSNSSETIPLSEEIKYVNFYLNLQQARFGSRLVYNAEVDETLLDLQVPKLSLECLIENAVVHGIEPKRGGGRIDVLVRCDKDGAFITVHDDGVGFDADSFDLNDRETIAQHIGLRNMHRRLQLLYGESYGLEVESAKDVGTTVTMRLPYSGTFLQGS